MKKIILTIIDKTGWFFGFLSRLWAPRWADCLKYRFARGFATGRLRGRFGSGKGFLLAPDVQLRNPENIHLGCGTSIQRGCILETIPDESGPRMTIGKNVSIGEYSHITCLGNITIGDDVLTGRYVLICDNAHGGMSRECLASPPLSRAVVRSGDIHIGRCVWLGDRVVVLGGVTIGEGAVIGANAVVTHDIPPYAVAAGVPAKVIKQL